MGRAVRWGCVVAALALSVGLASGVSGASTTAPAGHTTRTGPLHWAEPTSIDPTHGGFDSVSCTSAHFCLAGDRSGVVYRYDGRHWKRQAQLGVARLAELSCVTRTFCAATIGRHQRGYRVLTYDGHRWTRSAGAHPSFTAAYSDNDAPGLSCASRTSCLLVNTDGQYQAWNGTRWSKARSIGRENDGPDGLSCTRYLCAEVEEQGVAAIWHGTRSGPANRIAGLRDLVSVSCVVAQCRAIDVTGRVYHYVHGTWHDGVRLGTKADFGNSSLSCYAVGRCVATDASGNAYVLSKDGWHATDGVLAKVPGRVSCVAGGFCGTVGSTGQTAIRAGGHWGAAHGVDPWVGGLRSVACANAHHCLAVDANAAVIRYDGTSWSKPARLTYDDEALTGVSCPSTTFCTVISNKQTAWRIEQGHRNVELPMYLTHADSVSCSGAGRCMVAGLAKYAVSYYDGTAWTRITRTPFPDEFADEVSCVAAGCFVLTDGGDVWVYDGSSWTLSKHLVGDSAGDSLACTGAYCLASFLNDDVFQYSHGTWSGPQDSVYDGPTNLSCGSPRLCAGLNLASHVTVRVGRTWVQAKRLPGTRDLIDVACAGRTTCVVVDTEGHADVGRDTAPAPAPVAVATTTLPAGKVGSAYSATLKGAGGVGPYTWKLVAGGVPTGLTLKPDGTISGTPTAHGTWSLTPQVSDADGYVAKRRLTIKIAST